MNKPKVGDFVMVYKKMDGWEVGPYYVILIEINLNSVWKLGALIGGLYRQIPDSWIYELPPVLKALYE